jgi:putative spermidine/putrescine transport system substrate-binding protein
MADIKSSNGISRRQLMRYSAATLAACELTGIPSVHAETVFTLGTTGGTWGDGIKKSFIDIPGLDKKLDIRPSYLNSPTSVLVSRLLAQPGNPPFTVADLLDVEHFMAADAGAVQDYDLGIVTNYADIHASARQPARAGLTNWAASMTLPLISITYNTKRAEKPAAWQDLWSAKLKGKVGVPDFGWYGQTWLHAINKQLGGTEGDISKGVAAIADLVKKNGAVVIKNQEQAIKAFSDEEILAMPYWNGRTFALQASGVPVDMVYVPGTIQLHNGIVIAKATPFKEAANQFVNNTLDPQLQLEMSRLFLYPPANSKAKLPPALAHYAPPPAALEQVVSLDWAKINAGRVDALERWNREVLR